MNVSIIVATYGSAEWEKQGDNAAELARELKQTEVIRVHGDDMTLAQVRNHGAFQAKGDWLCFIDADDHVEGDYFTCMDAAFSMWDSHCYRGNMEAGVPVYPNVLLVPAVQYFGVDTEPTTWPVIPQWQASLYDLNCGVIGTLVPRRMFIKVGWFHEYPIYEDWELWLRCVRAGAHLLPVNSAVYCAQTRSQSRNNQDRELAVRVYRSIRERHADVPADVWANAKIEGAHT